MGTYVFIKKHPRNNCSVHFQFDLVLCVERQQGKHHYCNKVAFILIASDMSVKYIKKSNIPKLDLCGIVHVALPVSCDMEWSDNICVVLQNDSGVV